MKKNLLEPGRESEVRYLKRVLRCGAQGIEWVRDPKHMRRLVSAYVMEGRNGQDPITKERPDKPMGGKPLDPEQASTARSGLVMIHDVAQDRLFLAAAARVLSQRMASSTEGTEFCLKRVIRYLASHPKGES